jgi:diguanylate cyclase
VRSDLEKRYADPPEKCAEFLRLALTLMSRQDAGVHPISYAVWYDYVSGRNAVLKADIDAILAEGRKLDEDTTRRLYDQHVADPDTDTVGRLGDNLQRVMLDLTASTTHVDSEAARYVGVLGEVATRVSGPAPSAENIAGAAQSMLESTARMRGSVAAARERLDAHQREIEDLHRELARVRAESLIDSLTGLPNRRAFDQRMAELHAEPGAGFCLVIVDIDHFKSINDRYGHLFGDRVIRAIGAALKAGIKGRDFVSRYGGEEFAILLPDTPVSGALVVAENIRRTVAGSRIRRLNSEEVVGNITLSAGIAAFSSVEAGEGLFERADAALYRAKNQGRNRIVVAD